MPDFRKIVRANMKSLVDWFGCYDPVAADLFADSSLAGTTSPAKESGEAISSILAAEQSTCADECAQAIKEVDEAMFALRQARVRLEKSMGNGGAE